MQLTQLNVQKSKSTTFPFISGIVRGGELIQPRKLEKSGALFPVNDSASINLPFTSASYNLITSAMSRARLIG